MFSTNFIHGSLQIKPLHKFACPYISPNKGKADRHHMNCPLPHFSFLARCEWACEDRGCMLSVFSYNSCLPPVTDKVSCQEFSTKENAFQMQTAWGYLDTSFLLPLVFMNLVSECIFIIQQVREILKVGTLDTSSCVSDTSICCHSKYLDDGDRYRLYLSAILHTWGKQLMNFHPHIHVIVLVEVWCENHC